MKELKRDDQKKSGDKEGGEKRRKRHKKVEMETRGGVVEEPVHRM